MKDKIIRDIVPNVIKPARYIGGEFNMAIIDKDPNAINFAFAFPDSYEVGMSHLGMKILYGLLNSLDGVNCERVFAPMPDMARELKKHDLPLYSLETFKPLNDFDFIGFSLQYEMSLTNVLYMLQLANIALTSDKREDSAPIIMAGGPCCVNPEPFSDIFDIIIIGEAEDLLPELMDLYKDTKSKKDFLEKAALFEGVYVPSFYEVTYDDDGRVTERASLHPNAKNSISRRIVKDLDRSYYPSEFIVPYTEPVHDRVMEEVMRGCPRGCRFCQAGFIYRPARQKSVAIVNSQTSALLDSTGYEQVSFASLSTTDYKGCEEVIRYVNENYEKDKVSVSLPSMRIDKFSVAIAKEIQKVRKTALTFAPEAGSQRMRDVINKNISEEDILLTLEEAFKEGFSKIKLYFMIGLPYEQDEDIEAISELVDKIINLYYGLNIKGKFPSISVSVGNFVPKPFTPFQFFGQNSAEEFKRKQKILQRTLNRKVKFNYHNASLSIIEAAFARGDRRLNQVLLKAFENGCYFDSWPDHYNPDGWEHAFEDLGLDYNELAQRDFNYDEILPWDFINIGVDKNFFVEEAKKSMEAATTADCYKTCNNCGISNIYGRCDFEI